MVTFILLIHLWLMLILAQLPYWWQRKAEGKEKIKGLGLKGRDKETEKEVIKSLSCLLQKTESGRFGVKYIVNEPMICEQRSVLQNLLLGWMKYAVMTFSMSKGASAETVQRLKGGCSLRSIEKNGGVWRLKGWIAPKSPQTFIYSFTKVRGIIIIVVWLLGRWKLQELERWRHRETEQLRYRH